MTPEATFLSDAPLGVHSPIVILRAGMATGRSADVAVGATSATKRRRYVRSGRWREFECRRRDWRPRLV